MGKLHRAFSLTKERTLHRLGSFARYQKLGTARLGKAGIRCTEMVDALGK